MPFLFQPAHPGFYDSSHCIRYNGKIINEKYFCLVRLSPTSRHLSVSPNRIVKLSSLSLGFYKHSIILS